jgi:glycine/D-amino acid oxidase-like deaminating enzyme
MVWNDSSSDSQRSPRFRVGVVGAGVAGSTVALRLAELGTIEVFLLEQGPSLVNGPPFGHLHAGGNLYREISDRQCLALLEQSVGMLRSFPHVACARPTIIAVPSWDPGDADALLPRLEFLRTAYDELTAQDPRNEVLGPARHYFRSYGLEELQALSRSPLPLELRAPDEWMTPFARAVNCDTVKAPLFLVQEFGLSPLRLAASACLALERLSCCHVMLETRVETIVPTADGWLIDYGRRNNGAGRIEVDYLVNACGFRSGILDDMVGYSRARMVEFKASFLARWQGCSPWPEVIFHGRRGTPNGMAQLSPYADGVFQIHGMTDEITLFREGLVASTSASAQPQLRDHLLSKIDRGWDPETVRQRTEKAINHIARHIPGFASATPAGNPLFGAQQIPGTDPTLRVAGVSFGPHRYARTEIVKVSSALDAADAILKHIGEQGFAGERSSENPSVLATPAALSVEEVVPLARKLAQQRSYPESLV